MTIGGTVKSITEGSSYVFITIESEDRSEIRLTFRSDDPRAAYFGFRQNMMVEINPVSVTNEHTPRLTVVS